MKKHKTIDCNIVNENITSETFYDEDGWNALGEDDGDGSYCCGKRMVDKSLTFICLKCGAWEYNSS